MIYMYSPQFFSILIDLQYFISNSAACLCTKWCACILCCWDSNKSPWPSIGCLLTLAKSNRQSISSPRNPDNNSYVHIIDFSPRYTLQMNAVLSDVYTSFHKINNIFMILCYLTHVFGLTYTALLLFYFHRYHWSLGKDNLRTVHVCCKVCLLFRPIKVEKKDKSQSRFYKYFKKIS